MSTVTTTTGGNGNIGGTIQQQGNDDFQTEITLVPTGRRTPTSQNMILHFKVSHPPTDQLPTPTILWSSFLFLC
jgi:hypothetical protein